MTARETVLRAGEITSRARALQRVSCTRIRNSKRRGQEVKGKAPRCLKILISRRYPRRQPEYS